jgi:hypothetical protein
VVGVLSGGISLDRLERSFAQSRVNDPSELIKPRKVLILISLGRMTADRVEYAPEVDNALPIQVQLLDSGTAGGCQAQQDRRIVVPGEVVAPALPPRMVEGSPFPADRIPRVHTDALPVIAALT